MLKSFEQNGIKTVAINAHIPVTQMDRPQDIGPYALIKRVAKKGKIITETLKNLDKLKQSDYLFVGYPGHLDVLPAFLFGKLFRKKIVFYPLLILHSLFVEDFGLIKNQSLPQKLLKEGEKLIFRLCDLILADTNDQMNYMIDELNLNPANIYVMPLGADNDAYTPGKKSSTDKMFRVVYYGLYTPLHGVKYLIECAKLSQKHKDIEYVLVGKGSTFDENYKKAKKYKLENVIFHPDMREKDALPTLHSADVFLGFLEKHPTVERSVPNKVFQGLALGKTVITADAGAVREFFIDGINIVLCKPADPQSLFKAILKLKNDRILLDRIANNGLHLYQTTFTPKKLGEKFVKIVENRFAKAN